MGKEIASSPDTRGAIDVGRARRDKRKPKLLRMITGGDDDDDDPSWGNNDACDLIMFVRNDDVYVVRMMVVGG